MEKKSYKIEIYLKDGSPIGIRQIKIIGWDGEAVACSRNQLKKLFKDREDLIKSPAIYFLIGSTAENDIRKVYVGKTNGISNRLGIHIRRKDWWQEVVIFTSYSGELKNYIGDLESLCLKNLKEAARCEIDNSDQPKFSPSSEANSSVIENYYHKIYLLMPLLGHDMLTVPAYYDKKLIESAPATIDEDVFVFCKGNDARASGVYTKEAKLQVFKNSTAVKNSTDSFNKHATYVNLKKLLIKNKKLIDGGDFYIFSDDYVFDSPSAAADIVLGYLVNGLTKWKTKEGISLKKLEEK